MEVTESVAQQGGVGRTVLFQQCLRVLPLELGLQHLQDIRVSTARSWRQLQHPSLPMST